MPHGESNALRRREQLHGLHNLRSHLGAQQQPVWPGTRFGQLDFLAAAFFEIRIFGDLICVFYLHFFCAQEVKRTIDRDPVEPSAEVGAKLELPQRLVSAKQGLLDNLFSVLRTPGHAIHLVVHAPGMALHKDAKGLLVATQDLRHYGCVADFHLLRLDRNCREWLGLSLPLLKSLNAVRDPYDKQVIGRECTRMNTKIETNPGHFDRIHSLKIFAGVCIPRYASGLQKKADFQEEACSTACPTRSTLLSSKCLPNTCRPIGRPVLVCPQGTLIPGIPARSAVTVKMSARYMANGSSAFSPSLNAGVGAVGVTMAFTFRKASSISRVSNVRTRWALR